MNNYVYVALASLAPISELRGAIPLGFGLQLNLSALMFVAVVANILVIPLFFAILKVSKFRNIVLRLFGRRTTRKIARHSRRFELWGVLALIPFVAVPLPGSGAYTGVLIAELLGLDRLKSGLAIAIGVCIAAAVVLLASLGFIGLW